MEGPDPRTELIQKLLEYQKFKAASRQLGINFESQRDVFYRGAPIFNKDEEVIDVELKELLAAFQVVLESADVGVREIMVEEMPVEVRIREILDVLETQPFVPFSELFPKTSTRKYLIVTFLALLELIRLKQVRVSQLANFGEIHINRAASSEFAATVPSS